MLCPLRSTIIIIHNNNNNSEVLLGAKIHRPDAPWQARKEKSQKIRKVEGRIHYGRDGSSMPA